MSLRINYKSCYFCVFTGSQHLIPIHFSAVCSNYPACSPSHKNSDPSFGPCLLHEVSQVPYFVFFMLPLEIYYHYYSLI